MKNFIMQYVQSCQFRDQLSFQFSLNRLPVLHSGASFFLPSYCRCNPLLLSGPRIVTVGSQLNALTHQCPSCFAFSLCLLLAQSSLSIHTSFIHPNLVKSLRRVNFSALVFFSDIRLFVTDNNQENFINKIVILVN